MSRTSLAPMVVLKYILRFSRGAALGGRGGSVWRLPALSLACLVCALLLALSGNSAVGSAQAASLPDFEEDISPGLAESALRKLGAKACPGAALCLEVRWGEVSWNAQLRISNGVLEVVELHPAAGLSGAAAREQLEEFALAPVLVKAGDAHCDAFALVREGKTPEKAIDMCADKVSKLPAGAQYSVWYVDEDEAEGLLQAGSLEKIAGTHPRTVGARLSIAAGSVEVGYGYLGSLLQPSLKP